MRGMQRDDLLRFAERSSTAGARDAGVSATYGGGVMDHFSEAEHLLENPRWDMHGKRINQIEALTHAVLALVEQLSFLPMLGVQVELEDDDYE